MCILLNLYQFFKIGCYFNANKYSCFDICNAAQIKGKYEFDNTFIIHGLPQNICMIETRKWTASEHTLTLETLRNIPTYNSVRQIRIQIIELLNYASSSYLKGAKLRTGRRCKSCREKSWKRLWSPCFLWQNREVAKLSIDWTMHWLSLYFTDASQANQLAVTHPENVWS